jgi:hypothetical protein
MRHVATALLIIGAFLISIELVGRDRAIRWEGALRDIASKGEQVFGRLISFVATPWKKDLDLPSVTRVERWLLAPFLLISFVSL